MKRIAALLIIIVALAALGGITTSDAKAVNIGNSPVNLANVINTVYWDLDRFWIPSGTKPTVSYYDYLLNGQLVNYSTPCGHTSTKILIQGFYCNDGYTGGHIHFDTQQQFGYFANPGDGAIALWMAHEYAHHVEWLLRINVAQPYQELMADCFAGLYFRHGVYTSRKLVYNDYLEAKTMLSRMAPNSPSHGSAVQRQRAFDYGFARTTWSSCYYGWQSW